MKVLVIYTHPNPKSFNHAIFETVTETLRVAGIEHEVHDLYASHFDPVLAPADFTGLQPDVAAERAAVTAADLIIFIHPVWWMSLPAMLRGWVDRVLGFGFAYKTEPGKGVVPLLGGKRVMICTTTGSPAVAYDPPGTLKASFVDCVDKGTFGFCGLEVADHVWMHAVPSIPNEARVAMLADVKSRLQKLL